MKDFDINSVKPIKLKKGVKLYKDDSVEKMKDTKFVATALAEAMLEGDKEAFHEILSGFLCVVNKEELSRRSKVPIATIRRMAAGANFNIDNMLKITAAVHKGRAA